MDDMDDMDDMDVRDAVRTAGTEVSPRFRTAMRVELGAALRGEASVTSSAPSPVARRRGMWLAAAAAVVVVGVVATAIAVSDDDRGTLTPGTVGSTTDAPTTAAPTTLAPTTSAAPTSVPSTSVDISSPQPPSPDPTIPLLSVDASFPVVTVRQVIESAVSPSSPKVPLHMARFQGDGWTVVAQNVTDGPVAVAHFTLDGGQAWKVTVPGVLAGRQRAGAIELGPYDVLYAYYEDAQSAQVIAVPTSGPRGGETVGTWLVPVTCYETYCGPPMDVNGLSVSDGATAPYVDAAGAPTTATFQQPERASSSDVLGPAMPSNWVTSDDRGDVGLISQRSTVTLGSRSWTFDAVGVMMAGDYYFLRQYVLDDGGLLVWFTTSDGAGAAATRHRQFLGRLMPDGTSSFVEIPIGVIDVMGRDGRIFATTYDEATDTYTLAELLVG